MTVFSKLPRSLAIASLLLLIAACGDDGGGSADAGVSSNYSLEILNPPGDSIGLVFSGSSTLRVRYLDDSGEPIVGEPVEFSLLDSGNESTGGASLSSASERTDELGIARVDLVAGAERVNFRVEVTADQAPSVVFYIQVSDQGFINLKITSAHEGPRDPADYQQVQLRIYEAAQLSCTGFDPDDIPESVLPSRSQGSVGLVSEFPNLAADEAYTLIAWAEIAGGRPLATSCLSLAAERLRSGRTFSAVMTLADRAYELQQPVDLDTLIDLTPLTSTLPGASAWSSLRCPLGRAQLLLDCLTDAQVSDGLMDCDGESTGPLNNALENRRGALDADGCRPALDSGGADSIDSLLEAALDAAAGGWPTTAERSALADGYDSLTSELRLISRLTATSSSSADHRLLQAELGAAQTDLLASDRPVVESIGVTMQLSAEPILGLANHGFTLRYGSMASDAFETAALLPANVSGLGDSLGTELMNGIEIAAATGCTALESFVCTELGLAPSCANQCAGIAAELDPLMAGWLPALQSSGMDYQLEFAATLSDENNNLNINGISADSSLDAEAVSVTFTTDSATQLLPAQLVGVSEAINP
jgi:hypothetical protein